MAREEIETARDQRQHLQTKPISLSNQIVPRVDPFTHNTVQKYGKISICWNGTTPRVILKDPEMIREVLSNKQGHIGMLSLNPLIRILSNGLSSLDAEDWARHRRIITPAFHTEKLKGMIPKFSDSCVMLIEKWKKAISLNGTGEIDFWPEFQELTGDIISRTAFGSNFEEGNEILKLQKELQKLVIEAMQTLYIPGFRFIPTRKNQRRKNLDESITSMLKTLIQRKESMIRTRGTNAEDLLGLLLQSNKESDRESTTSNKKNNHMTMQEVIEECKQFYLAGHETTSRLLTWTMIVLARYPDWQDKARDEVLEVCQK